MTTPEQREQNALISVYDKTGIEEFASGLHELDWNIYASGGTAKAIGESGVPVTDIANLVGGTAILGHRVVTLSREVSAGLLADLESEQDIEEMRELGYPLIHMVAQDSYPLEETIDREGSTDSDIVESIDIGGPNLLRMAAKGNRIVLSVAEQRRNVLEWLRAGRPDEQEFIRNLTNRARYEVARYTTLEAQYYNGTDMSSFVGRRQRTLKYGENGWQQDAALYYDNRVNIDRLGLDQFTLIQGNEPGYVNLTDVDRMLQTLTHIVAGMQQLSDKRMVAAVGVKHGNACGVGAGVEGYEEQALKDMIDGDHRAIFGGLVMTNFPIDENLAKIILTHGVERGNRLLDGIFVPSITPEALEMLKHSKGRRAVHVNPALADIDPSSLDTKRMQRYVRGAMLEQPNYTFVPEVGAGYFDQHGEITDDQLSQLMLAWSIGSTSNSNTITIVKDHKLVGNGVGQQDRVGAAELAKLRAAVGQHDLKGAVGYSDSFLPFPDTIDVLADAELGALLTSSGSTNDDKVIARAKERNLSLLMVPDKIGRGFYGH